MAEVVFPEKRPAMCTIRGNAMSKNDPDASKTGEVITVAYDVDDAELRTKVKEIIAKASGEISLADAQIIVSGGRGLGDPQRLRPDPQGCRHSGRCRWRLPRRCGRRVDPL